MNAMFNLKNSPVISLALILLACVTVVGCVGSGQQYSDDEAPAELLAKDIVLYGDDTQITYKKDPISVSFKLPDWEIVDQNQTEFYTYVRFISP